MPSQAAVAATRQSQDSPPEAAIEATPESTPFVTPIKVSRRQMLHNSVASMSNAF